MKVIISAFCLLISSLLVHAQETMEVRSKLTKKITEVYHVLVNDHQIKQGLYQARQGKNLALASGLYTDNRKAGLWHFFDNQGNLVQNFDYDHHKLTYEAPDDKANGFKYLFDKKVISTDIVTKPIKIGGRFFGYIPLLSLFKKPDDMHMYGTAYLYGTLELLISPAGNLADYIIHLDDRDLNVNLNLLNQEDKTFIPATINGETVSSRILIPCYMDLSNNLAIN